VKYYEEFNQRIPREEASELDRIVVQHAQELLPGIIYNHMNIFKHLRICIYRLITYENIYADIYVFAYF
jgi:hypothetical protein